MSHMRQEKRSISRRAEASCFNFCVMDLHSLTHTDLFILPNMTLQALQLFIQSHSVFLLLFAVVIQILLDTMPVEIFKQISVTMLL